MKINFLTATEIAIKEIAEMLAKAEAAEYCEGGCSYKKDFCRCTTSPTVFAKLAEIAARRDETCDECCRLNSSCRC